MIDKRFQKAVTPVANPFTKEMTVKVCRVCSVRSISLLLLSFLLAAPVWAAFPEGTLVDDFNRANDVTDGAGAWTSSGTRRTTFGQGLCRHQPVAQLLPSSSSKVAAELGLSEDVAFDAPEVMIAEMAS
jgi:hypothetical protein